MTRGRYSPRAEIRPTPKPAKKRPARKMGISTAMVCKTTPRLNTQVEAARPMRRPMVSARKGDARAPKKVPAERMETMADSCAGETSGLPAVFT